jgi:hypothetical protein
MLHVVRLGAAGLLVVLLVAGAGGPSALEPATAARVAGTAPPDTIRASVAAGTPLVRSLPSSLSGAPVARYAILNGPALSGTAGYSFTWITRGTPPGTYAIPLRATHADAPPDTLVVRVELQPE